jgi:hypothetical protein
MKTNNLEKNKDFNDGWVAIHRKLRNKGYYNNSQYVHLWVHLLLCASHTPKEFLWNGEMKVIERGQFITGRKTMSQETGIPETTIERILKVFENGHQIGQQKTTKYRLITILNWKQYQDRTPKRTTSGQQADTINNDNNDNNIGEEKPPLKKEESLTYLEGLTTEDLSWFAEKYNCTKSQVENKAEAVIHYCKSKKKVYNNYKSVLQSWLLKDYGKRETNYLKFNK